MHAVNQMTDIQEYRADGISFFIRPETSDKKSVDEVVLQKGYQRFRPFRFTVEEGETWIDCGANIGAFTVWALHSGARRVIAYEPDPDNYEVLKLNMRQFDGGRFTLHRAALVADDQKRATLYQNTAKGNVWRNSIMRPWKGGQSVSVRCQNVLTALAEVKGDLNIKMDIEGAEMPILELIAHDRAILDRIRKLTFEWSFDVDPDLVRFRNVLHRLKDAFPHLSPEAEYHGHDTWPASWFPPCKTIYCLK